MMLDKFRVVATIAFFSFFFISAMIVANLAVAILLLVGMTVAVNECSSLKNLFFISRSWVFFSRTSFYFFSCST